MTTTRPIDLDTIRLHKGGHATPLPGADLTACLMEAVAWVAGEDWSDHPQCVSPILGAYGRGLNDVLNDTRRQELRPLIPHLIGTAGDGHDQARSYMALDWLIRTYTPAWLDLAGLSAEAQQLRDLRQIADLVAAQAAGTVVRSVQVRAAAWDAAWDAAWAAAWAATWAATRAATRDAARDAARDQLQPAIDYLQTSAIQLFHAMITPGGTR